MRKYATTPAETEKLHVLGYKKQSSDFHWENTGTADEKLQIGACRDGENDVPAYGFQELVESLPKTIDEDYVIELSFFAKEWFLSYKEDIESNVVTATSSPMMFNAVFDMVVWCLEKKLI